MTTLGLTVLGYFKYVIPDFVSAVRLRNLELSYNQLETLAKLFIIFNMCSLISQFVR